MGEREKPEHASVVLVGTLTARPELIDLSPQPAQMCRPLVSVNGKPYPVVAYEQVAKKFSETPPSSLIRILGALVAHHWRTAAGETQTKLEIQADNLEVLRTPHDRPH